jgi:hypothetical protein
MSWSLWAFLGICGVTAILMDGVVKIIRASKGRGTKELEGQLQEFIEIANELRSELVQIEARLETLEKIVTDPELELKQELNKL